MTGAERLRVTLARGVLLFRWAMVAFMAVIAVTSEGFRRPVLAWLTLALAAAWTAVLTLRAPRWNTAWLASDTVVCAWLLLAAGIVVPEGSVIAGRPFFSQGYPVAAALMWGIARGPIPALVAGALLSIALVATRPLNGVPLGGLEARFVTSLASGVLNYLVAPAVVGLVARLLADSSRAVEEANRALITERERAARLAEREKLARQIHDSVLQALALIHKRGRDLATSGNVGAGDVLALADLAGAQERDLRGLISRPPEDPPAGRASLRSSLEETARDFDDLDVTVSSVGPIWLDRACVEELTAAVRQALDNVRRHSGAARASVFADEDDDRITITVRDDGRGFVYDEQRLSALGKAGLLKSMKGRVEDLGGRMTVTASPGRGTEIEFELDASRHRSQES
ncbi:MAG TPA: ATP-binding protein [Actinomycetota bacterium]|nr:ATP-binding protein [Actinomycetota bacterium]